MHSSFQRRALITSPHPIHNYTHTQTPTYRPRTPATSHSHIQDYTHTHSDRRRLQRRQPCGGHVAAALDGGDGSGSGRSSAATPHYPTHLQLHTYTHIYIQTPHPSERCSCSTVKAVAMGSHLNSRPCGGGYCVLPAHSTLGQAVVLRFPTPPQCPSLTSCHGASWHPRSKRTHGK